MFWFSTIHFSLSLAMLIWLLLFTPHAQGQTTTNPLAAKLAAAEQELRLVKLENAARRKDAIVQAANAEIAKIDADALAIANEACKVAGLDMENCSIDVAAKTVTRKPAPPAAKK